MKRVLLCLGLGLVAGSALAQPVQPSAQISGMGAWNSSINKYQVPLVDPTTGYLGFLSEGGTASAPPYVFTPVSPSQYSLSVTTAVNLTVPTGAKYVTIAVEGGPVRYSTTTTATATAGMPLDAGGPYTMMVTPGAFSFIAATSATTTIDVEYFK